MKRYLCPELRVFCYEHEAMLNQISTIIGDTPADENDNGGRSQEFYGTDHDWEMPY